MEHSTTYDLRYEIQNAKLDAASKLVTPSGFQVIEHPDLREMGRIATPRGTFFDFEIYWGAEVDEDASSQATMTVYLPKTIHLSEVTSRDPAYRYSEFFCDLLVAYAKLMDQLRPENPSIKVIFKKADY